MMHYLKHQKLLAMYSSYIDAIVHDEEFMIVPIDDHLVHRGHGVIANLMVYGGHIYNLKENIEYIYDAARRIKINPAFPEQRACEILCDLVSSTKERNLFLQVYITAGVGNMMIVPVAGLSCVYATAWQMDPETFNNSIHEFSLKINVSQKFQAQVQNTHYLVNVLTRENSKAQGGVFGLPINNTGLCLGGVVVPGFVSKEKTLVIQKNEKELPIVKRLKGFIKILIESNQISELIFEDIYISNLYNSAECFLIGQDFLFSVGSLDSQTIGSQYYPVTTQIRSFLISDYLNSESSYQVDYSKY